MSAENGSYALPVLPVADVERSLTDFRALGFEARISGDRVYGFLRRGGIRFHVSISSHRDGGHRGECYFFVEDADALAAEWRDAGVPGEVTSPQDRPWGTREGEYRDRDGNILRFGHWIRPN